jgi:hypothetical protein
MRAAALVAALSTTAAILVTVAEIGHPPPDGVSTLALLLDPWHAASRVLPAPAKVEDRAPVWAAGEAPQP